MNDLKTMFFMYADGQIVGVTAEFIAVAFMALWFFFSVYITLDGAHNDGPISNILFGFIASMIFSAIFALISLLFSMFGAWFAVFVVFIATMYLILRVLDERHR